MRAATQGATGTRLAGRGGPPGCAVLSVGRHRPRRLPSADQLGAAFFLVPFLVGVYQLTTMLTRAIAGL